MTRLIGVVLAALTLGLVAPTGEVSAQEPVAADADAQARAQFQAGREAYAAGDYDTALASFRQARELSGRNALYYNIGLSADRLRREGEAIQAFRAYLDAVPDAANRTQVEERITAIEQQVAAREAAAAAGQTAAEVEAPPETMTLVDWGGQRTNTEATVGVAPTPNDTARSTALTPELNQEMEEDDDEGGSLWWVWLITGAVVAGGAVAAYFLLQPTEQDPIPGNVGGVIYTLSMD